jgi:hypothetical protein
MQALGADASRIEKHVLAPWYIRSKRHFEKRMIKQKGERMWSREEILSWTRDAVLERSHAPELMCKILGSERASEKGGTEVVDSAI